LASSDSFQLSISTSRLVDLVLLHSVSLMERALAIGELLQDKHTDELLVE
jgi:hypothetical protein